MHSNLIKAAGCSFRSSLLLFWALAIMGLGGCLLPFQKKFSLRRPWFTEQYVDANGELDALKQRIVRLYDNGTYTMFEGRSYSYGQWKLQDDKTFIVFTPEAGLLESEPFYWQVKELGPDKMQAIVYEKGAMSLTNNQGMYLLKAQGTSGKSDPFAISMHQWRIKPNAPETIDQIKHRTLAYLRFLKSLYSYGLKNNTESLPINWFAEPIQMHYRNGVRMAYADELADWELCFFNAEQSVKGYQFISGAMQKTKLSKTTNRFERNQDYLEELISVIETTDMGIR